jgi:hypothetical protein
MASHPLLTRDADPNPLNPSAFSPPFTINDR